MEDLQVDLPRQDEGDSQGSPSSVIEASDANKSPLTEEEKARRAFLKDWKKYKKVLDDIIRDPKAKYADKKWAAQKGLEMGLGMAAKQEPPPRGRPVTRTARNDFGDSILPEDVQNVDKQSV